jgi:hypothetical protein
LSKQSSRLLCYDFLALNSVKKSSGKGTLCDKNDEKNISAINKHQDHRKYTYINGIRNRPFYFFAMKHGPWNQRPLCSELYRTIQNFAYLCCQPLQCYWLLQRTERERNTTIREHWHQRMTSQAVHTLNTQHVARTPVCNTHLFCSVSSGFPSLVTASTTRVSRLLKRRAEANASQDSESLLRHTARSFGREIGGSQGRYAHTYTGQQKRTQTLAYIHTNKT